MYVRRATRAADPAYRCVQPRPAPRNRRQEHLRRRVPLPGNDPASTTGQDSPTPGLLSLSAAAASSCTCCLPAMRLSGTSRRPAPPGSAVTTPDQPHQTQTHPIGPGQHENDHDTRAAQTAPSSGSAEM